MENSVLLESADDTGVNSRWSSFPVRKEIDTDGEKGMRYALCESMLLLDDNFSKMYCKARL